MTHAEIQDNLEAFHDGQLSEPDRREIESHLTTCRACAEETQRLQQLSRAVFRPVTPPTPTDFFVSRVMANIRESEKAARFLWWRWPALALGLLALFLLRSANRASVPPSELRAPSTQGLLLASN